jgi:antitoxin CptB
MPDDPIALRRKRLLHRSRYRGCLECDILLGRFAERYVPRFGEAQLDRLERLLDEPDADILAWVTGRRHVPARHDNDVFRLLASFEPAA